MTLELGTLQVEALIVHEVPARFVSKKDGTEPRFSNAITPMDDSLRRFIGDRLKTTLGARGLDVQLGFEGAQSPVPDLIKALLTDAPTDGKTWTEERLVEASQAIADHLFRSQNGSSPAGLLAAVGGLIDGQPAVAVMKLEKEQGARFELEEVDGKRRFTLEQVRQLVFTDGTKVFKASIFRRAEPEGDAVLGLVSDEQLSKSGRRDVADFFLTTFLGCKLSDEPDITTKEVFYATEEFINSRIDDPVQMSAYQGALLSSMNSNVPQFNPRTFARDHLAADHQGEYVRFLNERGLPDHAFQKDITRIEKQVKQMSFNFEDFKVQASLKAIEDERVKVSNEGEGTTRLTAEGTLKSVS